MPSRTCVHVPARPRGKVSLTCSFRLTYVSSDWKIDCGTTVPHLPQSLKGFVLERMVKKLSVSWVNIQELFQSHRQFNFFHLMHCKVS